MGKMNIEPIINYSGEYKNILRNIELIKRNEYIVCEEFNITGNAPKQFIKLHDPGFGYKINKQNWKLYIAKVGHKYYPNESVTEHLLTRIGECLGFIIAQSRLIKVSNQIRFCSKVFLKNSRDQELIHGADIYAGYLNGDKDFVESIENEGKAREFFSYEFSVNAIKELFPNNYLDIIANFRKMLLFDCFTGNNDRHFYNWAVIRSITNAHPPYFSPIYDTARALFWNRTDNQLKEIKESTDLNRKETFMAKYLRDSKPKIGIEGKNDLNHFDLLEYLFYNSNELEKLFIRNLFSARSIQLVKELLEGEFNETINEHRRYWIVEALKKRVVLAQEKIL